MHYKSNKKATLLDALLASNNVARDCRQSPVIILGSNYFKNLTYYTKNFEMKIPKTLPVRRVMPRPKIDNDWKTKAPYRLSETIDELCKYNIIIYPMSWTPAFRAWKYGSKPTNNKYQFFWVICMYVLTS